MRPRERSSRGRRPTTTRRGRKPALLVTTSYDIAADYVARALGKRGASFYRFDTDEFPSSTTISFDPTADVEFRTRSERFKGSDIGAVWYRRIATPDLPTDLGPDTREFCEREVRAFLAGTFQSLPVRRWLSPPSAIALAERKPFQLRMASDLGFTVPATAITNDPAAVRKLSKRHRLIAKAVSSGYVKGAEGYSAIFTSKLSPSDLRELETLTLSPVIFQELVQKVSDIRVTVVGGSVFGAEILSQRDTSSRIDWRATADPDLQHRAHELPRETVERCRQLVGRLGLFFGAIDLALTPEGRYVFFEINPNGEWVWIEDRLGFPISEAIAEWLDEEAD